MKIDHIAIVTDHIERLKDFYVDCFGGEAEEKWTDGTVELYFIKFANGMQIELEKRCNPKPCTDPENTFGIAHLAFQVETKEELHRITEELLAKGVAKRSDPVAYGDDFYESSFFDPDGNIVELTVNRENLKK